MHIEKWNKLILDPRTAVKEAKRSGSLQNEETVVLLEDDIHQSTEIERLKLTRSTRGIKDKNNNRTQLYTLYTIYFAMVAVAFWFATFYVWMPIIDGLKNGRVEKTVVPIREGNYYRDHYY